MNSPPVPGNGTPTAVVTGGAISGRSIGGIHAFRGVPYAAPVQGLDMWRAPQPVPGWDGTRPAIHNGSACYQAYRSADPGIKFLNRWNRAGRALLQTIFPIGADPGPDCLNLNVWTPTMDPGAKLPVAFWIHGGGFISGSGAAPLYDGAKMASAGVVVVTINYRLGVFGFMGANDLFPEDLGIHNRGFLDQLQALCWVRENIHAFGGDPGCVTVMGESAGATSAIALAMSPLAEGLMHRVVCMSGAAISIFPQEEYAALAKDYFRDVLGVEAGNVWALERLTPDAVRMASVTPLKYLTLHAERYGELGKKHLTHFGMATGTPMFPHALHEYFRSRKPTTLDLMIGTCRDEMRIWPVVFPLPDTLVDKAMFKVFSGIMNPPEKPEQVLRNYRSVMPGASANEIRERAMTDALFRRWSVEFADLHSSLSSGRTFLYRFDWASRAFGGRLGAIHTIDLPGTFQNYEAAADIIGSEEDARTAGDPLHEAIVTFIKSGVPAPQGLPQWEPYTQERKACMIFDRGSRLDYGVDSAFESIW